MCLLKALLPFHAGMTASGDYHEIFARIAVQHNRKRAYLWYWLQILRSIWPFFMNSYYWRMVMFKNHTRIAFRNMKKQKVYTFINVFGLAFGIACCITIFLYVDFESSYDKYHTDLERIYRVAVSDIANPAAAGSARICGPPGKILLDDFPQVERMTRLLPVHDFVVKRGERVFYENKRFYADSELFSILTIPFLKGDPKTALDRTSTVVISETMAMKYFEDEDPIGQILEINQHDYEVTGVMADAPPNTHLKADCYISMKRIEDRYPFDAWFLSNLYTYIKVHPNADVELLGKQMEQIVPRYANLEEGDESENVIYFLQPVADIHLHSHLRGEPEPCTKPEYLTIFSAIGVFILLIACVNFINLSTAKSAMRAREVGMRKVVGARRKQLIRQFMNESLMITVLAVLIALLIVDRLLPVYRDVAQIPATTGDLFSLKMLAVLFGLVLIVSCTAGLYPAMVLSSFRPVQTLKGIVTRGPSGGVLRKTLVVGQFTLSALLIIGTLVAFRQLSYMKNQSLGFEKEQKLVLPLRGTMSIEDNYDLVKAEFKKHAGIAGATASNIVPGQQKDRWWTAIVGTKTGEVLNFNYVDPDFLDEYGLHLTAGRFFDNKIRTEIEHAYVINMTAVRSYGWDSAEDALSKRLFVFEEGDVIGVVDDFHYKGLQSPIEPLALMWNPGRFEHITLSVSTKNLSEIMEHVRATWDAFFPEFPFDFFFLDESFDRQYRLEERISRMLGGFTFLGLLIACLGLFGLASFTAEQKTKEIGIRKVLGASVAGLVGQLTKTFLKWVLIANVMAWPAAFFITRAWLKRFAYRIDIHADIFFFAAVLSFLIALVTVSYQAIKAAGVNPVQSLKYE